MSAEAGSFAPTKEVIGSTVPPEFQPGGMYAVESLPLPGIPIERNFSGLVVDVARHELRHALVGEAKGNKVEKLSVIAHGPRLGWTLFEKPVDQATAAASMVPGMGSIFGTIGDELHQ